MDPSAYVTALRRRWPIVLAVVGVSLILTSFTASFAQDEGPRRYSAGAVLLAQGLNPSRSSGDRGLNTLATLTQVGPIPDRVAEEIGYQGDPKDLARRLNAEPATSQGLLWLSTTSTDPAEAELIAHTYADEIVQYLRESRSEGALFQSRQLERELRQLQNQIAELDQRAASGSDSLLIARRDAKIRHYGELAQQQEELSTAALTPSGLSILDKSPAEPVNSAAGVSLGDPLTRILVGAILGLLAGVALALALERFDTRIRTKKAAETHFSFPVLAEIPAGPRRTRGEHAIVAAEQPNSPFAAAFRLLATTGLTGRLPMDGTLGPTQQVVALQPPQTILVTSSSTGEGKTTVTANLAASFAEQGKKTLVLSCDFRNPHIHHMFGVPNDKGLAEALRSPHAGGILSDGHVKNTSISEIRVVPSSAGPDKPGGLLGSKNMQQLLREARQQADVVLLDTPPILTGSEAAILFPEVDAVLVVARVGTTTAELAERTSELLKRLGTPVIGVALNGAGVSGSRQAYRDLVKSSDKPSTKKDQKSTKKERKRSGKAQSSAPSGKEIRAEKAQDTKAKEPRPGAADVRPSVVKPAVSPSSSEPKANVQTEGNQPAGAKSSTAMRKWEL